MPEPQMNIDHTARGLASEAIAASRSLEAMTDLRFKQVERSQEEIKKLIADVSTKVDENVEALYKKLDENSTSLNVKLDSLSTKYDAKFWTLAVTMIGLLTTALITLIIKGH